jgi:hypothetical protein
MAQHVYARLSGFGWTLVPLAPYVIERLYDRPNAVLVRHESPDGLREALLVFGGNLPDVELGEGTQALAEVLDLQEGPHLDHWRVETTVFTCRWPEGFTLASPASPGTPFELHGPDGALVYVQGPIRVDRLPPLTEMVGPGQSVRCHGRTARGGWVELEYEHQGQPWRQTHRAMEDASGYALVVSAQAPVGAAGLAEAAAVDAAASLAPYEGE